MSHIKTNDGSEIKDLPTEKPFRHNFLEALGVTPLPGFQEGDRVQDATLCAIYESASDSERRVLNAAFRAATKGKTLKQLLSTVGTFVE